MIIDAQPGKGPPSFVVVVVIDKAAGVDEGRFFVAVGNAVFVEGIDVGGGHNFELLEVVFLGLGKGG